MEQEKIEIDYKEYRKEILGKISEVVERQDKLTKKIERLYANLDKAIVELKENRQNLDNIRNNFNLYWYDPTNKVFEIDENIILEYNVIKVLFNKDTKKITQWVGYDSIKDAADLSNVRESTVLNYIDGTYKIPDWATYAFFNVKDFYHNYYKAGETHIKKQEFEN